MVRVLFARLAVGGLLPLALLASAFVRVNGLSLTHLVLFLGMLCFRRPDAVVMLTLIGKFLIFSRRAAT